MSYARSNAAAAPANTQDDTAWKARGFMNMYIPLEDGTDGKFGAVKLLLSSDDHVRTCNWLECADLPGVNKADETAVKARDAEKDRRLAKFASRVKFVYRSAEKATGRGFVLE